MKQLVDQRNGEVEYHDPQQADTNDLSYSLQGAVSGELLEHIESAIRRKIKVQETLQDLLA